MARNAFLRVALASLVLGATACGGKKADAPDTVDLGAVRARRDSLRQAAARDSVARARFTTCSDSVLAVIKKTTDGKKRLTAAPAGMIQPEVLQACGKPPAPAPTVATAPKDSSGKPAAGTPATKPGNPAAPTTTAQKPGAKDTTTKVEAPAKPQVAAATPPRDTTKPGAPATKPTTPAAVQTPVKPTLTPAQLATQRADSARQAREQAKQDSLKVVADRAREDSVRRARADSLRNDSLRIARETEVTRETFTYAGGARDPFLSLISEDKVGPEFNDLLLVGIYLDLRHANNSLAVLRDKTNQKRYKMRVGDRLGRLKVAQIRQTDVVFTVEDIGFERQETLSIRKREADTQ